jgi:hypothetical protein
MTERHPPLPVLGRGRPGRAPKISRNTTALGKAQYAMKTARPRGFRASLPPLPAAATRAARKPRTAKKWDGEILRGILGIWAILCVALFALVSLIERDRPDLLNSGNPLAVGVICASVVTVLFFGFARLSKKA